MADENVSIYGYESDEVVVSPFVFGLNTGEVFLSKFEWTPNGGKDGAELEALEIIFSINGTDKSYRKFPVTKAFIKNTREETTDPNSPEFKEAAKDLRATIFHIAHVFIDEETYKVALSRPGAVSSFKAFCDVVAGLLPKDFNTIPLDIFLQWQWEPSEGQTKSYLDLPKKMKYGRWLTKAQAGTWTEKRAEGITEQTREALWYENEKGEKHTITKNGWFMLSNFANRIGGTGNEGANQSASNVASNIPPNSANVANPPASGQAAAGAAAQNTPVAKPGVW